MKGFKATSDEIPRRRSHAISAKAQPLRSQVAQSIVLDPQAAAHAQQLAQQQMERLQAWRAQQVRNCTRLIHASASGFPTRHGLGDGSVEVGEPC